MYLSVSFSDLIRCFGLSLGFQLVKFEPAQKLLVRHQLKVLVEV